MDKAKLALVVLGAVIVAELVVIGVLALCRVPVPDQAWVVVYTTVGGLIGAAGAQVWNGRAAG